MYKSKSAQPSTRSRFYVAFLSTLAIVFALLPAADAAEWRFEPVLRIAGEFDDNPFLSIRTDVDKNESGYIGEASAKIEYRSDRSSFYVLPTVRTRNYGSGSDLNSDDQFLRLNYETRGQSSRFQIRAGYDRESVRTAERADTDLDIEDPDEILEDDSGRVTLRDRRERFRIVPAFTYRMSDVSSVNMELSHFDVRYDDVFAGVLTDYRDTRLNASYRREWTPRNTAILTATYRNYQTDQQSAAEVNGAGLTVGLDRAMTETSRFRVTAGFEDTDVVGNNSDLNWVGNVSFVRRQKTTTLLAQYRRSISSSGSGSLATRDSVSLNFTRALSDLISAGIGARIYSTNALDENLGSFDERKYVQLRAQFTWHISPVFSVDTNYRYTFLDRQNLGESANSNQITVWLNYRPIPIVRSR